MASALRRLLDIRVSLGLSIAAVALSSCFSGVAGITEVRVAPRGELTTSNDVSIVVDIATAYSAATLYRPTEVVVSGREVTVAVYPDWGIAAAFDYLSESVPLGALAAGVYRYVVAAFPKRSGFGEQLFMEGSFVINPRLQLVQWQGDGTVYVQWETAPDFVLQCCRDLNDANDWVDVDAQPASAAGFTFAIFNPPATSTCFFRLVYRPEPQ